jgi:hypothetical protein
MAILNVETCERPGERTARQVLNTRYVQQLIVMEAGKPAICPAHTTVQGSVIAAIAIRIFLLLRTLVSSMNKASYPFPGLRAGTDLTVCRRQFLGM